MPKRLFLCLSVVTIMTYTSISHAIGEPQFPRWRGFNLIQKINADRHNGPFHEEDFQMISELGFNFVRLPMDYRCWIKNKDWTQIDEDALKEIDQAVAWGKKYGIHVCLNFHRAPGWTVASPPEERTVWSDTAAQRVCAMHWQTFARRYKGIPSSELSFNLFNEPHDVEEPAHDNVVTMIVDSIRAVDPDRLIFSDGTMWGLLPCEGLVHLEIGQSHHCYLPEQLTHYRSWVEESKTWPMPRWPLPLVNRYLHGDAKKIIQTPLVIAGDIKKGTIIRIRVHQVSLHSVLQVYSDSSKIWEKDFTPGPGAGEWKKSDSLPGGTGFAALYDNDYTVTLAAPAKKLQFYNLKGDWMTVTEIGFLPPRSRSKKEFVLLLDNVNDNYRQSTVTFNPRAADPFMAEKYRDRDWVWNRWEQTWWDLAMKGVPVMVQEFGVLNKTPHDVTLRWMEDVLSLWKKAGWGWALWNLEGSFGVMDSKRKDVVYEDYKGHKLDRAMLELLKKY